MTQLDTGKIKGADEKFCESCGNAIKLKAEICPSCGVRQKEGINKVTLLVLTFLLGGIGVHKFYVRKNGQGVAYLLFAWTGIPGLIAVIEFFIFAFTNSEKLQKKYPESASAGLIIGVTAGGLFFLMFTMALMAPMIPNFLAYRAQGYDSVANADIKNAYTAAQAYFADYPDAIVTNRELSHSGYRPSEGVTLTIENGKVKTLKMTSVHEGGRKVYSVDWKGKIEMKYARTQSF